MRMIAKIFLVSLLLPLFSCVHKIEEGAIPVEWDRNLQGDFSFTEKWNYPENIFKNNFGQLVCDGICDPRLYLMRDEEGRIYDDSLDIYYQLLDTTHYYHTISAEARCYEWAGTDFAYAYREGDTIKCYTAGNVATHSVLLLSIIGDKCIPQIRLNSVAMPGLQYFPCNGGYIKIDDAIMEKDILKAEFNLTFHDTAYPGKPMWWKGHIYTSIARKRIE